MLKYLPQHLMLKSEKYFMKLVDTERDLRETFYDEKARFRESDTLAG